MLQEILCDTTNRTAARAFRKILPQELGTHYFRVAYAKVSIGENDVALKYLEKAVDNGWLYIDFLMSSKEFESMHGTSAWNRIRERIQETLNGH